MEHEKKKRTVLFWVAMSDQYKNGLEEGLREKFRARVREGEKKRVQLSSALLLWEPFWPVESETETHRLITTTYNKK